MTSAVFSDPTAGILIGPATILTLTPTTVSIVVSNIDTSTLSTAGPYSTASTRPVAIRMTLL